MDTNEFICKTQVESQMQKTNFQGKGDMEEINWEVGIDIYTLLDIKQITYKDLPCRTGNSTEYSVMAYMGKKIKKEWIYVYI